MNVPGQRDHMFCVQRQWNASTECLVAEGLLMTRPCTFSKADHRWPLSKGAH